MTRESLIPAVVVRRLSDRLVGLQGRLDLLERASRSTQLSNSSIENGVLTIRDGDGLPRGYIGIQPDTTYATVAVNGPPPPRPNAIELTGIIDGILTAWNGEFIAARPLDFAYLNVYVSGAGPDFIEGPSNLVTQFTEAGQFPVTGLGEGTYWCRAIAYNTSLKPSEASLTTSATSLAVVATDILDGIVTTVKLADDAVSEAKIAANAVTGTQIAPDSISSPHIIAGGIQAINLAADSVSAGKIAADAVTAREIAALTITANEIAANSINTGHLIAGSVTASKLESILVLTNRMIVGTAGGDRVEMNSTTGIEQWLSGVRTLSIPPSGAASFTGKVSAGLGVGIGQTVVVDPVEIALSLYPSNTLKRFRVRAWNATLVGGGSGPIFDLNSVNASNVDRGPFLHMEAVTDTTGLTWMGFTGTGGATEGGIIKMQQSGFSALGNQRASIQFDNDGASNATITVGGTAKTFMVFNSGGDDIYLDTGAGSALRLFGSDGTAELISNSVVKAFVIQHPTQPDRWLVHGCTETPDAEVQYKGEAVIMNGSAEVTAPDLPAYFESLVREDSRTAEAWVQLGAASVAPPRTPKAMTTPARPGDRVSLIRQTSPARPAPERLALYRATASVPRDGKFRIASDAPDGTVVHWRVTAARRDAGNFVVEPLKSDVTVVGEAPYLSIVPAAA